MKEKLIKIISSKQILIIIFALLALVASIQPILSGPTTNNNGEIRYNKYNNYTIFQNSYNHLKSGKDLYALYPEESWDLFKYTPTFSVFFGIFAIFPDWLGLTLWNLVNALLLLFAVYYLPKLSNLEKGLVLIILLIELLTSMQNGQSNALIAGLLVFSFGLLEKNKYILATLLIVFSAFIKLFGIVGFALLLFYPEKWKLALYTTLWTIVLFLLPLLFIDTSQYYELLGSYWNMLSNDHSISYGYSVMGWLNTWFGIHINKNIIVIIGAVIFLIPLIYIKLYNNFMFKYLALTSILIWVVIFNHKAESPTFIIAITGVALWFIKSKKSNINIILFVMAFILTSLSPTDIFPQFLREEYVQTYTLKAFPCILIWLKINYDMLRLADNNKYNSG